MSPTKNLSAAFIRTAVATAIFASSALPSAAKSAMTVESRSAYGTLVVADAHSYRHCHNLSKRTYCHKADRLPQNWPPNTDTPHRPGTESDNSRDCVAGSRDCASSSRYGKG